MHNQAPDLRCFQHCDRSINIICFDVPLCCPLCGQNTMETESRIPPYKLPSSIVTASSCANSLVLKPTHGDFICDFTNTSNLHIGVTDSHGKVYDFDEEGIHIGSPWQQCIPVSVLQNKEIDVRDWDNQLYHYGNPTYWTSHRYDENNFNCFDFVLGFLRNLPDVAVDIASSFRNKRTFCDDFIVKKTARVAQYINLYRRVSQNGYVCQKS